MKGLQTQLFLFFSLGHRERLEVERPLRDIGEPTSRFALQIQVVNSLTWLKAASRSTECWGTSEQPSAPVTGCRLRDGSTDLFFARGSCTTYKSGAGIGSRIVTFRSSLCRCPTGERAAQCTQSVTRIRIRYSVFGRAN